MGLAGGADFVSDLITGSLEGTNLVYNLQDFCGFFVPILWMIGGKLSSELLQLSNESARRFLENVLQFAGANRSPSSLFLIANTYKKNLMITKPVMKVTTKDTSIYIFSEKLPFFPEYYDN
jgi:hypothetical protein